jgi:acetyl esterase/lipase
VCGPCLRSGNIEAWNWYLARDPSIDPVSAKVSIYAAPARCTDLSGLPPTYIDVGDLDAFRDEDVEYGLRLMQAGVPVEMHVFPGCFHAWEIFAPVGCLELCVNESLLMVRLLFFW